ncbi:dCTP deaminase [bacterium CG_4_10_14_0_2_um_filter_33_32]|nr:MAG: dCTP deaminase [bacterium CG2_30_33_46]PIR67623.1 MAG: dCTP deaminase [bacterium CG10_big_fil_rev_8_21_14_0_10_33_18]PIU76967.1 MAG: dCTP deaminase [bacterium CG06_land_8_20_14_3_00_33_50]PIW81098.1 MAG: dCTP deaminase [bacterium CG_4_8_14_3_um_filter_33_28]PIY85250.1 MAG: dCTP deaminase [bacterium CG_4_10_14_0_8_um_filter_33_57]PIZ85345.1 MAG: dCTP deaminase [bacterium CG_4_10_14_0_2_um_filter_33_32]PJA72624.1 MAG: dCTP deaminase [bacterium CG_4_9_14_3_um_filter_33_26]
MILSDVDIKRYVKLGKIHINPKSDIEEQLSGSSLDLRLGNEFRVFNHSQNIFIDPREKKEYTKLVKLRKNKPLVVHPGEFILGITKEMVGIDNSLCARIDGKSSVGRLGIVVHSTAGHVNPGWIGKLTLEISNIGRMPVLLYPDMNICQLVFEILSSEAHICYSKSGKYFKQSSPLESKIVKEKPKLT